MKRFWIWASLLLALLLVVGCRSVDDGQAVDPTEEASLGVCQPGEDTSDCDDEGNDEQPVADATTEPTREPTAEPATPVEDPQQNANPTDETNDPMAPRDTDWVLGAENPVITLIEYGDYL